MLKAKAKILLRVVSERCRIGQFDIHICNIGSYFLYTYLIRGIVSAGLQFVLWGLNRKSITLWLTGENCDQHLQYSLLVNETYQNPWAEIYFMNIIYVVISACICVYQCLRDSSKLSASTLFATERHDFVPVIRYWSFQIFGFFFFFYFKLFISQCLQLGTTEIDNKVRC